MTGGIRAVKDLQSVSRFCIGTTLAVLGLLLAPMCGAATLYVSPSGSDDYTAQQAQDERTPWQSIAKACDAARPGDRIVLLPGMYRQGDIIINRSGTKEAPIAVSARPGAILSGGVRLTQWTLVQGSIYRSDPIDLAPFEASKSYPTILLEDSPCRKLRADGGDAGSNPKGPVPAPL